VYSQSIPLSPGWNAVSTPRVLESHTFSAPETSANFDIFALDASQPSGWATLAQEGQTEFTPLYGYFINNKTGVQQTLTFNYLASTTPAQRLFERSFNSAGWYSIGVANPSYALPLNAGLVRVGNQSAIFASLIGDFGMAIDFGAGVAANSVAVSDHWQASVNGQYNQLNDLREIKGYAIYVSSANGGSTFDGFQNDDAPVVPPLILVTASITNAASVVSQDIAMNVPNAVLGGFVTNFAGEPVTISGLTMKMSSTGTTTGDQITSISIVDQNGAVVAGPVDAVANVATFSNPITFPVGAKTYTVKGKVPSTGWSNGSTVQLNTTPSSWTNPIGQTTGNTITISTANFTMNTMTVRGAALSVSAGTTPASQTIVAGSQNALVGTIQLDASQSGEDIRLSSIPVDLVATSTTLVSYLSNCQIYDGTATLTTGSNVKNTLSAANGAAGTQNVFTLDNSVTVPKGTVKNLSIMCSLSSSASTHATETFKFGVDSTVTQYTNLVSGLQSGNSFTPTVSATSYSGTISVGTGGFAVSTDASSPSVSIAAGGTTGLVFGVYKFRASNDSVSVQRVGLHLTSAAAADIANVTLWSGSTQIGSATFAGGSTYATSTLPTPLTLTKDTDISVTVKADIAQIGSSQPGTSGNLVKVDIDTNGAAGHGNTHGVGLGSGVGIDATGFTSVAGTLIFRSFPVLSQASLPSTGIADGRLIHFAVTANSAGSIGIDQIGWKADYSNANVTNAKLHAYTDAAFSSPVSGQAPDGQIGATHAVVTTGAATSTAVTTNPIQVSAGQTVYFELRADVVPFTGSSVVTTILGDAAGVSSASATSLEGTTNFFVWTPNTVGTAVKGDPYFVNGASVSGLPSSGFSATRSN
jgi:hypothetical protein